MNLDEVAAWFDTDREPILDRGDAIAALAALHPRTVFFKSLRVGSHVLDAGSGSLENLKNWPAPARSDLLVSAFGPTRAERPEAYDAFEYGDWDAALPSSEGTVFDAMFVVHFIERLSNPVPFLDWLSTRLNAGGRLYLEWPSPYAALLPTRSALAERGIDVIVSNFSDDLAHRAIHDRSRIVSALAKLGFFIESQGYVSLPFIEDEILAHRKHGLDDSYAVQAAYWSRTRWLQYVVAVRV